MDEEGAFPTQRTPLVEEGRSGKASITIFRLQDLPEPRAQVTDIGRHAQAMLLKASDSTTSNIIILQGCGSHWT